MELSCSNLCSVDRYTWAVKVYCTKSGTGERERELAKKAFWNWHKKFSEKAEPCMLTIFTLVINLRKK